MTDRMTALRDRLKLFNAERNWASYHSPKNLTMALAGEAAEILEIFQWLTLEESNELSDEVIEHLKQEIGDVQICLTNLANAFDLDPIECANDKIVMNAVKYPVKD